MLDAWLEQIHPPASWGAMIEAVEFLGEEQLERDLKEKYMHVTSSSSAVQQSQRAHISSL